MFCVSRNLAAFYNLRAHSANLDISRISCSASRFSKKIRLGGLFSRLFTNGHQVLKQLLPDKTNYQ